MTSRIGLALVAFAVVSLVVSSGGFSSVEMERSIEVAVADEKADQLVAFYAVSSGANGSTINVTNRADSGLTITRAKVDGSQGGDREPSVSVEQTSAGPGSNASISVTDVPCDEVTADGTLPIAVTVETASTTIETTVDVADTACDE